MGEHELHLRPGAVFCQFIGWSRSGTTLLGSLLNAHPGILIAQEADVSSLVAHGADRAEVLAELLAREADFAARGREWNGYDYRVAAPVGATARSAGLSVIGDKKAAGTIEIEALHPGTLARVADTVGLPLRLLCVTREPRDTIATLSRHLAGDTPPWFTSGSDPLEAATDWFLLLATLTQQVLDSRPAPVHVTSLERLTADPRGELTRALAFLGIDDAAEDYLGRCAAIVKPRPRRAAAAIDWPAALHDRIDRAVAALPILRDQRTGSPAC